MSKKSRLRAPINIQDVKGSKTLVKSAWQHFYHNSQSLWVKLNSGLKMTPLAYVQSYVRLLTHWASMTRILFRIVRVCHSQFKCTYLKNENFSKFLFHFSNFHQILNILKKKMIVITNVFPKLKTVKDVLRQISEKHCFRTPFDSQHVKGSQRLMKSAWEHFYHIFSLLWHFERNWFGKLFLVLCSIFEYKSNFKQFPKKWAS